jgi:hypothetical protein
MGPAAEFRAAAKKTEAVKQTVRFVLPPFLKGGGGKSSP